MNSFFDIKRTGYLIKKTAYEFRWNFLIIALVQLFSSFFFLGIKSVDVNYADDRINIFVVCMIMGFSISLAKPYMTFSKKEKLISVFTSPSSILEHWIVSILHILILIGINLLFFIFADYLIVNFREELIDYFREDSASVVTSFKENNSLFSLQNFKVYMAVSLMFFIGISTWVYKTRENSGIYNLICFIAVSLFYAISVLISRTFFGDSIHFRSYFRLPFSDYYLENPHFKNTPYIISAHIQNNEILGFVILPILLLTLAIFYFRLKETEI